MNSTLPINRHDTTGHNAGGRIGPDTALMTLPRRFDIHEASQLNALLGGAGALGQQTVVDGSLVEMIDLAAIEALTNIAMTGELAIEAPSVALEATIRYAADERLLSALEPATMRKAA